MSECLRRVEPRSLPRSDNWRDFPRQGMVQLTCNLTSRVCNLAYDVDQEMNVLRALELLFAGDQLVDQPLFFVAGAGTSA